jgi:hypothetical protein
METVDPLVDAILEAMQTLDSVKHVELWDDEIQHKDLPAIYLDVTASDVSDEHVPGFDPVMLDFTARIVVKGTSDKEGNRLALNISIALMRMIRRHDGFGFQTAERPIIKGSERDPFRDVSGGGKQGVDEAWMVDWSQVVHLSEVTEDKTLQSLYVGCEPDIGVENKTEYAVIKDE